MFVIEQNRKIIFDMRHYNVYTMDKVLLVYCVKSGFSMPSVLGKFESHSVSEEICQEIKKLILQSKKTRKYFVYKVPNNIKNFGGKINDK